MDSAAFRGLVDRVVALSPRDLTFTAAASHTAATLTAFPDGVTEAILLSTLPPNLSSKAPSAVDEIYETRHVGPREVIDLVVKRAVDARMLELQDGQSTKHLLHALAGGPLGSSPPIDLLGRRVRLVRTSVAATGFGESAPPLLLLPTRHAAVYVDPARDRELLKRAESRLRGQGTDDGLQHLLPLVLLRIARATPTECPWGARKRALRRMMLVAPDADPTCEIEAELLLWDEDSALLELLPPNALLLIANAEVLSSGDAAPGGVAAQIGLASAERTLVCIVDEMDSTRAGLHAHVANSALAPGCTDALVPRPSKQARRKPRGADEEEDSEQPSGPPLLATPPPVDAPSPPPGDATTIVGRVLTAPTLTNNQSSGIGSTGGCRLLTLRVDDGAGACLIELHDAGDGGGLAAGLAATIRPGHHLIVSGLTNRPQSPHTPTDASPQPPLALPPPPPHTVPNHAAQHAGVALHAPALAPPAPALAAPAPALAPPAPPAVAAPMPPMAAPAPPVAAPAAGSTSSFNLDDELSDEALLAMDLDFLEQRHTLPPTEQRHTLPPTTHMPAQQASHHHHMPPQQPHQPADGPHHQPPLPLLAAPARSLEPPHAIWGGVLAAGSGASHVTNLSMLRAALRSPQLPLPAATDVSVLLRGDAVSATCRARVGACEREANGAWRLTLLDAAGASIACEGCDEVVDELLETGAAEWQSLAPAEQRERVRRACEAAQPRLWALTRESGDGAAWRANVIM